MAPLSLPVDTHADDTIRFFIRAFIPKSHTSNPDAIKPIPGEPGRFMLVDVLPTEFCFDTDHRQFSSDPAASARLTSDITLSLSKPPAINPSSSKSHRAGTTIRRICATGKQERAATADVNACSIGNPAEGDNRIQVVLSCSAGNPLVTGAPKIDYGGTLTYDREARTVGFKGTVGNFPAFEAYAALNKRPFVKIFAFEPAPGSTPWALFEAGLGLQSRSVEGIPTKLE